VSLLLGLDGRLRVELGSRAKTGSALDSALDVLLGPAATAIVGRVALVVHGGGSALKRRGATTYGAFVVGGLGTAF